MIDAKVSFMTQLEAGLTDTLTVDQMKKMQTVGYSILDKFDLIELADEMEQDDLLDCYVSAMFDKETRKAVNGGDA